MWEIICDTWASKIQYYQKETAERQLVHELKKDPTARIVKVKEKVGKHVSR